MVSVDKYHITTYYKYLSFQYKYRNPEGDMARPKIANEVILEIKERREEGLTIDQIQNRMQDDRDAGKVGATMPGRNTIAKYVREYEASLKDLDKPFEWSSLKKYDLPWEASSYLLEIQTLLQKGAMIEHYFGDQKTKLLLTFRQATWCWRVHLAAPDIDSPIDVWYLAQRFANRELAAANLDVPLYFADLEAHLAHKPWSSQEREQSYLQAVRAGDIPVLRRDGQLFGVPDVGQHRIFAHLADDLLNEPTLLWSQQLGTVRRITEKIAPDQLKAQEES